MSGFAGNQNNQPPGNIGVSGGRLGTALEQLLLADEISPGSEPSYQLCKTIRTYHPLGAKLTDTPVKMAMSQPRDISIPGAPDAVVEAYQREWARMECDKYIENTKCLSRCYGIAAVVFGSKDVATDKPIEADKLADLPLFFNVMDPLNMSGSMVMDQDPNSPAFQSPQAVIVNGSKYHLSRSCVVMNEQPIYISYTNSGFGYVGRSVYQRALFPLKSFVQTMMTDDMVSQKAGVLVAKIKAAGSVTDRIQAAWQGIKRTVLKYAGNYNVISISPEESIESLNLQNIDGAVTVARDNILKNVAIAADMPGKLLSNEVFVMGFGEGTEDAKNVAHYIDGIRKEMDPLFRFFDHIVQARAWNKAFVETMQNEYPEEYGGKDFNKVFFSWKNAFAAKWPSLLSEPDSEKIRVSEVVFKSIIATLEVMLPELDPGNKARAIEWASHNLNESEMLFKTPLILDWDEIAEYAQESADRVAQMSQAGGEDKEPDEPRPFAAAA